MKVLLFRPRPDKETIGLQNVMICEPLELEYISANIEALGHTCTIVDMIIEKKSVSYFVKHYNPDVVGITGYISHVNIMKGYAKEAKEVNPQIVTIIGGVHAEVNPADFESPYVDYIIRANGIRTFIDILNKLEQGKKDDGQTGREEDETSEIECIYVPGKKPPKKDTTFQYLYPDRDKVKQYRSKYYYMFHRNCTLIKTSFGCPYNCKFCFCRQIMDDQYFARDLEDIVNELSRIPETEIYIVDDDFLVGRERILAFCDLLEQRGIHKKYLIYGRADYVAANEDVIKRFKEVGLRA
ncbi:MAG: cobalamin-dependent protein, partial [Lachnospiraceae bacterium]|nr:cobalamin-dependent protein [Lachnospiraceae bacterium]